VRSAYLTIRDPARLPGVRMADEDLAISFGSFSTDDTKKAISSDYHVRLPGAVDVMFCRSSNLPHSTSTLPPSHSPLILSVSPSPAPTHSALPPAESVSCNHSYTHAVVGMFISFLFLPSSPPLTPLVTVS